VFQILDGLVNGVALVAEQRGVEPRRGIIGIQSHRQAQFLFRQVRVPGVLPRLVQAPGLAEVAAQKGAIRLQRRGGFQIVPPLIDLTAANAHQTAAQPAVGQRAVGGNRLVKIPAGLGDFVLRAQREAFQSQGLRVAGRQFQALLQSVQSRLGVSETEFHLGDTFLRETEGRGLDAGAEGHLQGLREIAARLRLVGTGHPFGGEGARGGAAVWLALDGGDHFLQGPGQRRGARLLRRPVQ